MKKTDLLTIGETAKRCGVAASTLRFYESRGLIESTRAPGNQRRFRRAEIRKVSVIRVAQNFGMTLAEIGDSLAGLPDQRVPNQKDWQKMSASWRNALDERINAMIRLRDQLDGCIGCGCLSLKKCALYNGEDVAAIDGAGPRYLLDPDAADQTAQ